MKEQLYRVARSRSFTRLLSIVAVAVVAFAALQLLFVPPALAGAACCTKDLPAGCSGTACTDSTKKDCLCDPTLACNITRSGKSYTFKVLGKTCWNTSVIGDISTISSELKCDSVSEETFNDLTVLERTGLRSCRVKEDGETDFGPAALCHLDLAFRRNPDLEVPGPLATCSGSTLNYAVSCEDVSVCDPEEDPEPGCNAIPLVVLTGADPENPATLKCDGENGGPNGTLVLGFPLDLTLAVCNAATEDGVVLSFQQTYATGSACDAETADSSVTGFSTLITKYFNNGTFDDETPPGQAFVNAGTPAQMSIPIEFNFHSDINVKPCDGPKDMGKLTFTILGGQNLAVTQIDQGSLRFGTPPGLAPKSLKCNKPADQDGDGRPDLTCHVNSCPGVAQALGNDPTITGSLKAPNGTTKISGTDTEVITTP